MAVVSQSGPSTIFTYRISEPVDWLAALGADAFDRADRGPFVTPIAAGRWRPGAGFAVVAPMDLWSGRAILCGLRQEIAFDALDAAAAVGGARLLEMSALEGRALAETLRQSAALEERLHVLSGIGDELAHARDATALLARAAQEVAQRMGAGAASIMVVEGDELRLRASVGLPTDVPVGQPQRIGEGIAGYVAASGEKIVLRGRVDDVRFRGTDPDAGESVSVPLHEGGEVLGVLSVKRPGAADTFADRHELLEAVANDLGRALRAMNVISDLERERARAHEEAGIARAVAARQTAAALRGTLALGHHAVAMRDRAGRLVAVESVNGDDDCRQRAIDASARAEPDDIAGTRVGFARHGGAYHAEEG